MPFSIMGCQILFISFALSFHRLCSSRVGAINLCMRRPNFVLPVGKGAGRTLTMLLQCQLPYVLFTQLEDYKQCVFKPLSGLRFFAHSLSFFWNASSHCAQSLHR